MQAKIDSFKCDIRQIVKKLSKGKKTTNGILNSAQLLHMYNKN
jgi:hypothetical protein